MKKIEADTLSGTLRWSASLPLLLDIVFALLRTAGSWRAETRTAKAGRALRGETWGSRCSFCVESEASGRWRTPKDTPLGADSGTPIRHPPRPTGSEPRCLLSTMKEGAEVEEGFAILS